jgi:hypothetical protein
MLQRVFIDAPNYPSRAKFKVYTMMSIALLVFVKQR